MQSQESVTACSVSSPEQIISIINIILSGVDHHPSKSNDKSLSNDGLAVYLRGTSSYYRFVSFMIVSFNLSFLSFSFSRRNLKLLKTI